MVTRELDTVAFDNQYLYYQQKQNLGVVKANNKKVMVFTLHASDIFQLIILCWLLCFQISFFFSSFFPLGFGFVKSNGWGSE